MHNVLDVFPKIFMIFGRTVLSKCVGSLVDEGGFKFNFVGFEILNFFYLRLA